jgi:hypothetical protein
LAGTTHSAARCLGTPLDPCHALLDTQIARVATLYAALGQPALIRTRSFDDLALQRALRDNARVPEGASTVLDATLDRDDRTEPDIKVFEGALHTDWRRDHTRLSGADPAKRDVILASLAIPCAFAGLRAEGAGSPFVACGLIGVHDAIACLHLVVTDPSQRRRGLSSRVVARCSRGRETGRVRARQAYI